MADYELKHPTKSGGKLHPAGTRLDLNPWHGDRLVRAGRAVALEGGTDRMVAGDPRPASDTLAGLGDEEAGQ